MLNALIKVPDTLDISDATWQQNNPEVLWELVSILDEYTEDKAPGSVDSSGTKIVHCLVKVDSPNPLAYMESLFIIYGLSWEVVGLQSWLADTVWKAVDIGAISSYLNGQGIHLYQGMADWVTV